MNLSKRFKLQLKSKQNDILKTLSKRQPLNKNTTNVIPQWNINTRGSFYYQLVQLHTFVCATLSYWMYNDPICIIKLRQFKHKPTKTQKNTNKVTFRSKKFKEIATVTPTTPLSVKSHILKYYQSYKILPTIEHLEGYHRLLSKSNLTNLPIRIEKGVYLFKHFYKIDNKYILKHDSFYHSILIPNSSSDTNDVIISNYVCSCNQLSWFIRVNIGR